MPSIFSSHLSRPIQLSMLFFEVFEQEITSREDDEGAYEAMAIALTKAGVVEEVTEEHVAYCAMRMNEIHKEAQEKLKEDDKQSLPSTDKKKQFAEDALKWLADLTPDDLCLYVAGYDFNKASHLYCDLDREDVLYMGKQKVQLEWERMRVSLEASLFGFGGGYGDDQGSDENTTVIDLTNGDTTGLDKFFGKAH